MSKKPGTQRAVVELDRTRVAERRSVLGLSQKQLADRAGISQATLSAVERERNRPVSTLTAQAIADALGLPVIGLVPAGARDAGPGQPHPLDAAWRQLNASLASLEDAMFGDRRASEHYFEMRVPDRSSLVFDLWERFRSHDVDLEWVVAERQERNAETVVSGAELIVRQTGMVRCGVAKLTPAVRRVLLEFADANGGSVTYSERPKPTPRAGALPSEPSLLERVRERLDEASSLMAKAKKEPAGRFDRAVIDLFAEREQIEILHEVTRVLRGVSISQLICGPGAAPHTVEIFIETELVTADARAELGQRLRAYPSVRLREGVRQIRFDDLTAIASGADPSAELVPSRM